MYLADVLRLISSGAESELVSASPSLGYARTRAAEVLAEADLYSFTPSALDMASDLVIDTPDRLERVAAAVFETPRRIFVEAGHVERMDAFRGMRGFPFVSRAQDRFDPRRIGLDIHCFGQGRARIGVLWDFPKSEARRLVKSMQDAPRTRLGREALVQTLAFGVGFCAFEVDLGKASPVDRAAFEAGGAAPRSEVDLYLTYATEQVARREGRDRDVPLSSTERRGIGTEAWRLYRLNQMATAVLDPRAEPSVVELMQASGRSFEAVLEDAQRDLDGEIIYALAFLAALDAGGDSLEHDVREARSARRARPVSPRDLATDRISVVRLDISGRPLRHGVEGGRVAGAGHGPRARHFVRGHLFLARNARMTYRRPHWRGGSQGRKTLRRVT